MPTRLATLSVVPFLVSSTPAATGLVTTATLSWGRRWTAKSASAAFDRVILF
jgi:hypothetical protein